MIDAKIKVALNYYNRSMEDLNEFYEHCFALLNVNESGETDAEQLRWLNAWMTAKKTDIKQTYTNLIKEACGIKD